MRALLLWLLTIPLCAETRQAPAESVPERVGAETLQVGMDLTSPRRAARLGDEVPIQLTVSNRGTATLLYSFGEPFAEGFELMVRGPDGRLMQTLPEQRRRRNVLVAYADTRLVEPGESADMRSFLNDWVTLDRPGLYGIQARLEQSGVVMVSPPVTVELSSRTSAELAALAQQFGAQLALARDDDDAEVLVRRLSSTMHPRTIPFLIDSMYRRQRDVGEARALEHLSSELEEVKPAVLAVARRRGLAPSMKWLLRALGATGTEMRPVIARSLAADNRPAWPYGALAAQIYGDDHFTDRLIALASDPGSGARDQAI